MTAIQKAKCHSRDWHGCYDDGWNGLIVPDAFSHPAKMAHGLLRRILKHCLAEGWLKPGDTVVDPFGGIGTGGIMCSYEGLRWIGCELEPRFVDLARQNFELHRRRWEALKAPLPVIVQGDSRRLSEVLGACECVVSSPPFNGAHAGTCDASSLKNMDRPGMAILADGYGTTPGQLGSMPPGDVSAVIGSPPFSSPNCQPASVLQPGGRQGVRKAYKDAGSDAEDNYGSAPGQLGSLPPGSVDAALQADCVLGSPPYEGSLDRGTVSKSDRLALARELGISNAEYVSPIDMEKIGKRSQGDYGATAGQLGSTSGDTFWAAAKQIILECHKILRPGGMAIWVVKNFVRKKQIVDFTGDWIRLCEACGFRLVCQHRAMLVKETTEHTLFDGKQTRKVERKSFFRRLAEKKGSPRIDWESVLCMEAK